jgi:hypothetical protein
LRELVARQATSSRRPHRPTARTRRSQRRA